MCGITCFIDPAGVTEEQIKTMTDALAHRGPDNEDMVRCGADTVGLGHRRLSIIDLAGGNQPMASEDGSTWIVFNGEIYNYQEIRGTVLKDHIFKTDSDTEVLLRLYEVVGEKCLDYLRGMFAFAIYDEKKKTLFAARDHLGQKPFYYFHDKRVFACASEIKAILALKPELKEMDPTALYEYLTLRIVTPPRSMFKAIKKLPPAHCLTFREGKVDVRRYWTLLYEPKTELSFDDALEALDREIENSVRYHLVSDVPVGAFLSGGFDSGIIVTMMSRHLKSAFKTFSGSVKYAQYDEGPYARMVAESCGTDHYELSIEPSLVRQMPAVLHHMDEPSDPLSVCIYSIAELARKKVKVVLGGDGGDELFGGYDRYYGNRYVDYYALIPEVLRKQIFARLIDVMPEGFWYRSSSHKLRWIHQLSFFNRGERYGKSLGYFYFSDRYRRMLYTDTFSRLTGMFDPEANLATYYDNASAKHAVDRMLSVDCATRMPDHPNMILDRMAMAHGLEARSPFLDHRLAEFCARLRTDYKIKGFQRRRIQRALAQKLLPEALMQKPKQGFSSALTYLLKREYRLLFELFLHNSSLVKAGYLKQDGINHLLSEHLGNRKDHGNRLWLLCNAEMWFRMYIENMDRQWMNDYIREHAESA